MNPALQDGERKFAELLGRLKEAGPEYPAGLLAERRRAVLATLGVLPAEAMAGSVLARLTRFFKGLGMVDKVILAVEVAAITGLITYGVVNAYIYRRVLTQLIHPSPAVATIQPMLPAPSALSTHPATATHIPSVTPCPSPLPTPRLVKPGDGAAGLTPVPQSTGGQTKPTNQLNPTNPPRATRTRGLRLGNTKTAKP